MVEWKEFDNISKVTDKWLPLQGEGNNMATQASTAINKLVYRWYNDGDVYDNRYSLEGWWNDLSCYANWLYNKLNMVELRMIESITSEKEYEDILFTVASKLTREYMESLEKKPKTGSIYTEEGPFEYIEYDEEEGYF